jgi:parvulin-like peptidyl-prolyl isomerase
MKRVIAVISEMVAALALSACASVLAPPAAVIGSHKLPTRTITDALHSFEKSPQFRQASLQSGPKVVARQFEQSYLSRLIRRYILTIHARRLGITVTNADIDRALAQLQKRFGSKDAFNKAMAQQGLTLAQTRVLLRDNVLERKVQAKVTALHKAGKEDLAWSRWLIAAYQAAHVKVNPIYGVLDIQNQSVVDSSFFPGAATPSPTPTPSPTG